MLCELLLHLQDMEGSRTSQEFMLGESLHQGTGASLYYPR